ncbi:amidase [Roseiterribacter gracilis]|uniref:Amidase n=1 Tax=Roseiterribacter gracilis TaxID=2812848 RepID=A0A8S8XG77_9PROT|nr:amidase [Rhodospirillales bacterium TMPK1]
MNLSRPVRALRGLVPALLLAGCATQPGAILSSKTYPVEERSVADLQRALREGAVTSEQLVAAYLARIDAIDRNGPKLNSVIALNPDAAEDARALDAERRSGKLRGPLHGIPVLLKDNIESKDKIATTAGSLALINNFAERDAPVAARLRAAGAVVLGKTNLSEWANIRSTHSTSGWSGVAGLTRNPYALNRNACGSSSGSGSAAAASLATITVGTETDGSVTCPSSLAGLVGLKPTVGLVPRTGIIPIASSQDTAGPMTRSVTDAAVMLTVMAGSDARDAATKDADKHKTDFAALLRADSLRGKRIGVLKQEDLLPGLRSVFERALGDLRAAGAVLIEVATPKTGGKVGDAELVILLTELKVELNKYLASTPTRVATRSLADVIAFNRAQAPYEMRYFEQELFEKAEKTGGLKDKDYQAARATIAKLAGKEGLDRLFAQHRLDAIVAPTAVPAWTTDLVDGDNAKEFASMWPAVLGYPHLTVPMGLVHELPVGLSFVGKKWDDGNILSYGFAYEQRSNARVAPTYKESVLP